VPRRRRPTGAATAPSDRFNEGSFVLARFSLKPREHESGAASHPAQAAKQGSWALDEEREATTDSTIPASASTCVVSERSVDDVAIVSASGVVDLLTAPQFEGALRAALAKKPRAVVVDLTEVEFLASAGMGVLVAAHDEASPGTWLCIVAEGPATSRPLKLVGIADIVPLYATLDEALASLSE
jgi:anti-sigma B factor antagonist